MIKKILDNWLGWIFLIIVIRLIISLFADRSVPPQEQALHLLFETAIHSSDVEVQKTTLEALKKNAQLSPKYREIILSLLEKQAQQHKSAKVLLDDIESDPIFVINQAVERLSPPFIFYVEPICYFFPILTTLFLLTILPWVLSYFTGKKSLQKIFGNYGVLKFVLWNIPVWGIVGYCFVVEKKMMLPAHIVLVVSSLAIYFILVKSHIMSILIEATPKILKNISIVFTILQLASFAPYIADVSYQPPPKIPEEKLLEATRSVREQKLQHIANSLLQILQSNQYSENLAKEIIDTLGIVGNENLLVALSYYLQDPNPILKNAAAQAISNIITPKEQQEQK